MKNLSRVENIMQSNIDGEAYTKNPLSRVEELLLEGGGGGGGSGPTPEEDMDPATVEDVMSVISTDNDE